MAARLGVDHVRYDYLQPDLPLDASHERFVLDHNRCILCTRCVRVCDEVEGAHTWDVRKCVQVCPTGALVKKGVTVAEMEKKPNFLGWILNGREKKQWNW
jgi:bidirectional [NiFe] hydrogenase diaphorase subunit